MKRREILLMLLPCAFFALAALWMRVRETRNASLDRNGPFRLVIEKIETRPISAKDAASGYDTEVAIVLNHSGQEPKWWGKQNGNFGTGGSSSSDPINVHLFYETAGKRRLVKMPPDFKYEAELFYWRPGWKSDEKRYEARFFLKLAELPIRAEKTVLRGKVAIEDGSMSPHRKLCAPISFSFTVRQANQAIKKPLVSRDPGLTVRRIEIKKFSAAEQKTNGGYDTELNVYTFDHVNKGSGDSSGGDKLLDEHGKEITNRPGWSMSHGVRSEAERRSVLNYQFRLKSIPRSEKNVNLKTNYSRADRWPLQIRIPLRRNGKDLSGNVQALPDTGKP